MSEEDRSFLLKLVVAGVILLLSHEFLIPWVTQPQNFSQFIDLSIVFITILAVLLILDELYNRLREKF